MPNTFITDQITEILRKLVSFKSITPKSHGSIEYISELLGEHGFVCDIQIFGQDEKKTTNLYAKYGKDSPTLCFAGHVDVVPPMNEDLWLSDPFELKTAEEKLYGRGVVDMKGAIACALVAVLNYLNNGNKPNGAISFLLTSDEEGEATYGTKAMLEHLAQKGEKIDFTILGEPTSKTDIGDTMKIGRRGSANFTLTVTGKQGHVAYPDKAINPVNSLVRIADDLVNLNFDDGTEFFEKTNLEITTFDVGNKVVNIIPEKASLCFNIRFNNMHTAKALFEIIKKLIEKHKVTFDLEYSSSSSPFIQKYSKNMQKFAAIVKKQCNLSPKISTNGGTSDARFIYKYSEVIELGLNFAQAHKINEYTKNSDLQSLYNVYYSSLVELF